ncbi:TPA: hypothetical protein NHV10_004631 [Citrobacter freundii]|nr:hypothetical protein [Citrobacter braakii]HCE9105196.1 hypothetical protein [Citrobacter freundii]
MTALNKYAELRKELSNPAIGSNAHLRKLALALLDKLEAAEKRIAELQIARDKCFLSGLKTGWEYGIADDTEWYNREIADAQEVIYRAAGIGVKGE